MACDQIVDIIENDPGVRESLALLLQSAGLSTRLHPTALDFLASDPTPSGCVVSDVRMPEMSGLDLLAEMKERRLHLPTILMTAFGDVPQAVKAMKLGAVDFIEKPFDDELMVSSVRAALARRGDESELAVRQTFDSLTAREKDVLTGLLQGKLNKTIAFELGVSVRTVESHRANLMAKTKARSLSELIRMSLLAEKSLLEA